MEDAGSSWSSSFIHRLQRCYHDVTAARIVLRNECLEKRNQVTEDYIINYILGVT